jgi:hypothetical protein
VRKDFCGIIYFDEIKTIGVKTYDKVPTEDRNIYKRKRRKHETNPKNQGLNLRPRALIECLVAHPHPPMLVDYCLCIHGVEQYQISLTMLRM